MAKTLISNPAFGATNETIGFNLVPQVNNFNSIFAPKPLEKEEENTIQALLTGNFQMEGSPERIKADVDQIKAITSEIKAIQKQGIVLIGERIEKAKQILKSYRDGTFTIWLKQTFKSKQTGYNILAYYEFYKSLPTLELKESFRKLPQKAAYTLASRAGEIEAKMGILQDPSIVTSEDILMHIRQKLPLPNDDKRRSKGETALLMDSLDKTLAFLKKREGKLPEHFRVKLLEIRSVIDQILSS